jgi:hypothetical protein
MVRRFLVLGQDILGVWVTGHALDTNNTQVAVAFAYHYCSNWTGMTISS